VEVDAIGQAARTPHHDAAGIIYKSNCFFSSTKNGGAELGGPPHYSSAWWERH
jgi:hypothetical protein